MQIKCQTYEIFPWDESFSTNIPHIDERHKKLVHIINTLCGLLAVESEKSEIEAAFQELFEYTIYHFNTEEALWRKYFESDEEYVKHKLEHKSLKEQVRNLKFEQEFKSYHEVVAEVLRFLVNWLTSHILGSDMRLAKIVLKMDAGIPLKEAKISSRTEMYVSEEFIKAILELYDRLTSRTLLLAQERTE